MKLISQFILKYIWHFKFEGAFPKSIHKFVLIVAPHTTWLDFPLGLLIKWSQVVDINYIGKDSLFKPPFGFFFKWVGGTPVDRTKNNNLVDAIIQVFNEREKFKLSIAPEGTRKKTEKWKTGFYHIAKGAQVPIVMLSLDFENKILKISEPYYTTDNMEADFKHFEQFYKGIKGYHAHLS
ncbi:MAG: 1-acyl-sn-glycerol-3-phosphate acyltransferase [Flavobacteriaceae bacterium]|nr:1-acyl-sn-glycerol-3-phosphate acyltransferase [Flavobacteriaceae bacterium]